MSSNDTVQATRAVRLGLSHFELALAHATAAGVPLEIARVDALRRVPAGWMDEIAFTIASDSFTSETWAALSREIIGPNDDDTAIDQLFSLRRGREPTPSAPALASNVVPLVPPD